ncbi:hypothetical protein QCB44_04250 [Thiomicrorhabdus sp. zzn3]|uniref:hypothetical protein n=1 Tax=Thiomicrorhabdus sp. zzn3 TaxID=3039775 RepID=UPI0024365544|nr:hypothetical protein [Thiomicrorhabdus sp. zzn3]MDG6777914.1 hypothetical protein [Thiomicrorhabdus sp. zzn3]
MSKKILWTSMFSASLGLTACGGGSGSGTIENTATPSTVSGIVADGYLIGAEVCLDLNLNKKCDTDEPSATTGAGGAYSFEATQEQLASAPIIAKVIPNVTVDTDIGGVVTKEFILSAPAGKPEFVSPLTTMVQSKLELNPSMTPEQAESTVKTELGLSANSTVDLYEDFIEAGQGNEADADEYKVLHQTAQIVARVLATFTETLTTTLQAANVTISDDDVKEIQLIVANALTAQLPTIYSSAKTQIEENGEVDTDFADAASAYADDSELENMTADDFEDSKKEFSLLAESETISAVDALTSGGAVFMSVNTDHDYDETLQQEITKEFVEVMAMLESGFYQAKIGLEDALSLESESYIATRLEAQDPADEIMHSVVTQNADGSLSFTTPDGYNLQVHTVAKMSLAGKEFKLDDIIDDFDGDENATVTFAEGDYAYQFAYSETPQLHLGNIESLSGFSALCPTVETSSVDSDGEYACELTYQYEFGGYDDGQGGYIANTFSDFYLDASVRADAVNQMYWNEDQLNFYIKNTETEQVAACKYEADSYGEPVRDMNGTIQCQANTEVLLGNIVTGTLGDQTPYVAVPFGFYDDGKLDIEYQVYTTDGSNAYRLDESFEKDDSIETGVFKPFNLSATKRIIEARSGITSSSTSVDEGTTTEEPYISGASGGEM